MEETKKGGMTTTSDLAEISGMMRLVSSTNLMESIQSLVTDRGSVDVRIRCKDHQPSDGLGAHKVILAAASPTFLAPTLLDQRAADGGGCGDHLVCLHLPDFTSFEVGHIMSLLYYGEVWLTPENVEAHKCLLNQLQISVKCGFNSIRNCFELVPRNGTNSSEEMTSSDNSISLNVDKTGPVRVKCEPQQSQMAEEETQEEEDVEMQADERGRVCKLENVKFERETDEQDEESCQTSVVGKLIDDNFELQSVASEVTDESTTDKVSTMVCTESKHCNFSTSSLSRFQAHLMVHHRKRKRKDRSDAGDVISCGWCQQDDVTDLDAHMREVHFPKSTEKCDLRDDCDARFDRKSVERFIRHFREDHFQEEEGEEWLFCDFPKCNFSTRDSSNLTQHLRVHNDERNFECSVCLQKFVSSSHLKVHTRSVHTKEKLYQCDFCEKRFPTNWQKKSHTKTNHLKEKPSIYPCQRCHKAFYKHQSLSAHLKSCKETSEESSSVAPSGNQSGSCDLSKKKKSFQICETCGERLKGGATSLRRHQCVCRTGDVSIRCPTCSKTVLSRSLKSHMQYHRSQEQNKQLLSCLICHKSFTTSVALKRHVLIHENAFPFKCETCDKVFRQKGALQAHSRVHTGLRFSCQCGKLFITKSLLNQHKKVSRECAVAGSKKATDPAA